MARRGDLTDAAAVRLSCDSKSAIALPPSLVAEVKGDRLTTIPLVAIEEDADSILVAPLEEYRRWDEHRRTGPGPVPEPNTFRVRFGRSSVSAVSTDATLKVGGNAP